MIRSEVDRPSRRKRWLVLTLGLLAAMSAALVLAIWLVSRSWGLWIPDAAVSAAIQQYGMTSGLARPEANGAVGWSDCAVVNLYDATARDGASVAMLKVDGAWKIGRVTSAAVGFDADDIAGSRASCLAVAHSTGPLTNGAPPEE